MRIASLVAPRLAVYLLCGGPFYEPLLVVIMSEPSERSQDHDDVSQPQLPLESPSMVRTAVRYALLLLLKSQEPRLASTAPVLVR